MTIIYYLSKMVMFILYYLYSNITMNKLPNAVDDSSGFEKRVYTVEEIMDILSIGKNTAYALVNSGVFHFVKVGGHYRISKKSFDRWLDNMDSESSGCQLCD